MDSLFNIQDIEKQVSHQEQVNLLKGTEMQHTLLAIEAYLACYPTDGHLYTKGIDAHSIKKLLSKIYPPKHL